MKRLSFLFIVLIMVSVVFGGTVVSNMTQFKAKVRQRTGITSTSLLPDTTLTQLIQSAVLWTSTEVGGVESQHRFVTVAEQAMYAIPDTITSVLYTSVLSEDGGTHSIKAFMPELVEDVGGAVKIDPTNDEVSPSFYNIWADSIQIIPIPQRVDTVILKCYVEHPLFDTLGSSVGNDTLQFRAPYTEAAISYACYLTLTSLDMDTKAAIWLADYEKKKASLTGVYRRKVDQVAQTQ